jgi:hypothetical protein
MVHAARLPGELAEGRCISAETFAIPASSVLAYGKYAPRDSPPASLGFDRNTPTFTSPAPSHPLTQGAASPQSSPSKATLEQRTETRRARGSSASETSAATPTEREAAIFVETERARRR